ncbi:hypothetical protein CPL00134L_CDS0030 [Escherichia phage Phagiculus]
MINGYKSWIYLVCLYNNGLIAGVSSCFDNEKSANEFVRQMKDDIGPTLDYMIVKRALLK